MKEREDKFSRHVGHLEEGGLNGWCASCSAEERHRAIARTVRKDGYAKTIERLDFVANVADRKHNEAAHVAAREDIRWAEEHERGDADGDDPRRDGSDEHRVRPHEAEREGRRFRVRGHMAANPRR